MIVGDYTNQYTGGYHNQLRESLSTNQYKLMRQGFEHCSCRSHHATGESTLTKYGNYSIYPPVNQHSCGKCPTYSWFTAMLVYQRVDSIQFIASENSAKNHHSQWVQTYVNLIHRHVPEDLGLLFSRVCCASAAPAASLRRPWDCNSVASISCHSIMTLWLNWWL